MDQQGKVTKWKDNDYIVPYFQFLAGCSLQGEPSVEYLPLHSHKADTSKPEKTQCHDDESVGTLATS